MRPRIKRLVHRPEYVSLSVKEKETPYAQTQEPTNTVPKKVEAPMVQPVRKFPLSFYLFRWCLLFFLSAPGLKAQQIGETFQAPYRYKLENPTKLPNVPDSMHICVAYENCEYPVEIAFYHICPDSPLVLIQLGNTSVVFAEINSIQEEYNDLTGIWGLHFKTMLQNDCVDIDGGNRPYVMKFSLYYRPVSKTYYFEYDAICEGVFIRNGDAMLKRAIKYSYIVPKKLPPGSKPR